MSKTNPNDFVNAQQAAITRAEDPVEMSWDGGLTKREYFAAMAMQGFIAGIIHPEGGQWTADGAASIAVECANALIDELNKEQT